MIKILDKQTDKLLDELTNKGDKIFWDDMQIKDIKGLNTFEFKMLASVPTSEFLQKRSRFLIPAEEGGYEEFIVFEAVVREDGEKEVYGVASYADLDKQRVLEPRDYKAWSLFQYVSFALRDTEWTLGSVEFSGIRSKKFDSYLGAYEFLQQIQTLFNNEFEMVFRVETKHNRITGRYIDFVERIGFDTQKEIVLGKDLLGVEQKIFNDRIITALVVVGPENEAGNRQTITVKDDDAFQRWNRNGYDLLGIYEVQSDNQEMTIAELERYGRTELNKRIAAVIEWTITALTLESIYDHERVLLGDRIRVKNPEFNPPLYADARAIEIKRSITDPSAKEYTIGEVVTYTEDEILKVLRELQAQYGTKVLRQPTPPPGDKNVIWFDTTQIPNVAHTWNGVSWERATPIKAEEVGAETPSGAQARAEIENIRTIRRIITTRLTNLDIEHAIIIDNAYLEGNAVKTSLNNAKAAAHDKYVAAQFIIDEILDHEEITPVQRTIMLNAVRDTEEAQGIYNGELKKAFEAVAAAQAKEAMEQAEIAERAAQDAFEKAETALTEVIKKVDSTAYEDKVNEIMDELREKVSFEYVDDQIALIGDGISKGAAPPEEPADNALWFDTNTNALKRWDGTNWVSAEIDIDNLNVYTREEIDNALNNFVTSVTYQADQAGLVADIQANATGITQNAEEISLKANQDHVDAINQSVSSNKAAIDVNAAAIALKASSEEVTTLTEQVEGLTEGVETVEIRLSDVEFKVSDDEIISKVTGSTSLQAMFNEKADASDLEGYASSTAVDNLLADLQTLNEEFTGIEFGEFVTQTEIAQRDLSILTALSASSGVNLIRNSVGLAALEHWNLTGNGDVSPSRNPELDGLGYYSGFLLQGGASGVTTLTQDVAVVTGKTYTLSYALRNVNGNGNITVNVLNAITGDIIDTAELMQTVDNNYHDVNLTLQNVPSSQLRIQITVPPQKQAIITALMLNIGAVAFSWTTSVGELYNTTIKMDLTGLRVSQHDGDKETGFTVMTPEKFAGYYNESGVINENTGSADEVFRMDKDEFVMKKATIKEEITMDSLKVLNINEPNRKGWAFVPNF